MNKRLAGTVYRTYARGAQIYSLSFLASAASTAIQHQDEAVVTGVTRSSDGVYVFTLGPRYKRIVPMGQPNVELGTATKWTAAVYSITEGDQANAFSVAVKLDGTLDDPEAAVTVVLHLVDAGGT